jgi:hypothetical protein
MSVVRDSYRHHVLLGRAARQLAGDVALSHDDNAIADANDLGEIGGNHQGRATSFGKVAHDFVDRCFRGDVYSARRFAEHENLGSRASQRRQ